MVAADFRPLAFLTSACLRDIDASKLIGLFRFGPLLVGAFSTPHAYEPSPAPPSHVSVDESSSTAPARWCGSGGLLAS